MNSGIATRRITEMPVAVIDFETTGLTPGFDRVVEVAVVRIDPGKSPRLVFDTLINPCRPMAATEVHGISDADVASAPKFKDIAGELLTATQGCILAAYNVYFDIRFLNYELANAGVMHQPPHFCLMYLRTMLGLGTRCKLEDACRFHSVEFASSHFASQDALAASQLYACYLSEIQRQGVATFADLANLRTYKFNSSFGCSPFPDPTTFGLRRFDKLVSRAGVAAPVDPTRQAIAAYWDALKTVLADLEITEEELEYVAAERARGGLQEEQIRVIHARAFVSVLSQFAADRWIDDRESRKLKRLNACLAKLGWAPGM
ncbi:3'-5' exonuclease [Anatilimnocola floriformis]|uniref:3'-5' exonuclease n=1 Tax=Anatilimnocola floriformis TaxID=2948575 RepID=UPI0020C2158F|nr:3'-5' exonuclease [Anatilimnocola floriformis]